VSAIRRLPRTALKRPEHRRRGDRGVNANSEKITMVSKETNARISALDEYEVRDSVCFTSSLELRSDSGAKVSWTTLRKGAGHQGYVVEVTGYASAMGMSLQPILSQRRADAVVQYLADNMVPLRRIVTLLDSGEMPAPITILAWAERRTKGRGEDPDTKALSGTIRGMVSNTDKKL